MRIGRRLGVDLGDVRIGIAVSDPDGMLATPVETVLAEAEPLVRIAALIEQYEAIECVLGLPRSLSGGEGPAAKKVRVFAAELKAAIAPVPVRLFDERLTTRTAEMNLASSKKKKGAKRAVIDQAAAVIILQAALDAERIGTSLPGEVV